MCCGGAINSPQLLMLSGIGPTEHLNALGIPVVKALPGVGQNLMDHVQVGIAYACTEDITQAGRDNPEQALRYQNERMGLLTSNLGEAGGFVKLSADAPAPELQFHFGPDWFVLHGSQEMEGHGFTILPGLVGTKSVGDLKLHSADPFEAPLIDPKCLFEEEDVHVMLEGVKLATTLERIVYGRETQCNRNFYR